MIQPLPEGVKPCRSPVEINWDDIENGVYGPEELFQGWAQDRVRLVQCKRSNDALIIYVEDLRFNLRQQPRPGEVMSLTHIPM